MAFQKPNSEKIKMEELKPDKVKSLIGKVGPSLGYDYTSGPVFPESRKDVCAVVRTAEDGSTYGFDTAYLVWANLKGQLNHEELINTRSSKDYIHIDEIKEDENDIVLKLGSGGSYSGSRWDRQFNISKVKLGLK